VPNPLVQLIADGRIGTLAELRSTYHKLVMQTHPDAVGSDKLVNKFLQFNDYYQEAKAFLAQSQLDLNQSLEVESLNHRLEFYKELFLIESLEVPYAFHPEENQASLETARKQAFIELSAWRPDIVDLYQRADAEHSQIKKENPRGPYLRYAMALNVRPLIHNILACQLTGQEIYAKQSRQNLNAIMQKIAARRFNALHGFITFMIEDLRNRAAVID
jgi:hypothetical protein